ncbi:MAG: hypothetical protein PVI01_03575 [Gemmatimonadales bacterium]|jgi:hypothetical protein
MGDEKVGPDKDVGVSAAAERVEPTVKFPFGAVFTSLLTIPLQVESDESLMVSDFLPTTSGRLWIADGEACLLKIYAHDGRRIGTLARYETGLRRPVSLTSLHERWVAVLDGYLPAVAILDESGHLTRRFPLPELDRPLQVLNLGNRRLAVVGSGWGAGAGHLVHLYTPSGDYVESFFGEPRIDRSSGRAYVAGAGSLVYIGHSRTDSFAVYDVEARAVVSFSNLSVPARLQETTGRYSSLGLSGLFATPCGPLIAQYANGDEVGGYSYDLYGLDGAPIALGLRSWERVVGVEGSLYYSFRANGANAALIRVWRLRLADSGLSGASGGNG